MRVFGGIPACYLSRYELPLNDTPWIASNADISKISLIKNKRWENWLCEGRSFVFIVNSRGGHNFVSEKLFFFFQIFI